jgi:thioredoxin reductase (NADPH)
MPAALFHFVKRSRHFRRSGRDLARRILWSRRFIRIALSANTVLMRADKPSIAPLSDLALSILRPNADGSEERKNEQGGLQSLSRWCNRSGCSSAVGSHIKVLNGVGRFTAVQSKFERGRMNAPHIKTHRRLVIIGSGPAGYTAAIYAARALLDPLMLSGFEPGGQLMITTDVENYPGFESAIQGPWLMEQMRAQAAHVGARIESEYVVELDLSRRPFAITCDSGRILTADALVLATGAKAKWLDLASEESFKGYGVSACATCDGFFFRGKRVIVVGGGNSAVEEALYLSNIASTVTIVHRRDAFKAEKILQERLFQRANISIIWDHAVDEVLGSGSPRAVEGARLRNLKTGAFQDIEADGFFVAIGHAPASELVRGQLALKANGYIQTAPGSTQTSVEGVFAAGDVADDVYRQAVTAAGLGCMAALEAERWLAARACPIDQAAE